MTETPGLKTFESAFILEKKVEFTAAFEGLLARWSKGEEDSASYRYQLTENWQAECMLFFILWEDFAREHHLELGISNEMGIYDKEESVVSHEYKHLKKAHELGIPIERCSIEIDLQRVPYERTRSVHGCNSVFTEITAEDMFQVMLEPDIPSAVDLYSAGWSLMLLEGDIKNIPSTALEKWGKIMGTIDSI